MAGKNGAPTPQPTARGRVLIIVARHQPEPWQALTRRFAGNEDVQVLSTDDTASGAGLRATVIDFEPTGNKTTFLVHAPAAAMYWQGSLRDVSFTSADSTYAKTAIEIVDASGFIVENVSIGGTIVAGNTRYWSGASAPTFYKFGISGLPRSNPGARSKQLWYDPADGNRVKLAE